MNFKYQFLKFCFPKKPTKRVLALGSWDCCPSRLLVQFSSHFPCASAVVWYWNCNVSVTEVVPLLRVRLHLTHWCPRPAHFFPVAKPNTNKNVFNNTWGTAVSTSYSADANDCPCLQAQAKSSCCNSSCIHIYAHITLTTMFYITGDLGYNFQRRAKNSCPSQWDKQPEETHFSRWGQISEKSSQYLIFDLALLFL